MLLRFFYRGRRIRLNTALFLLQTCIAEPPGRKGQRLFGVHTGQPHGVGRCKQQLPRCVGVLRSIPAVHSLLQSLLCLRSFRLRHTAAHRTLLQLLGTHEGRQGGRHRVQLVGQGGAALFLILERIPAVYTGILRR